MLKYLAILCSTIFVLATTNISEVFKIPIFVEHFINYEGNLMEFVVEHYDNHQPDSDWDTDQKLPFFNPPIVLMVHAQLPQTTFNFEKIKDIKIPQKPTVYIEKDFSDSYLSRIFQPPRFI